MSASVVSQKLRARSARKRNTILAGFEKKRTRVPAPWKCQIDFKRLRNSAEKKPRGVYGFLSDSGGSSSAA